METLSQQLKETSPGREVVPLIWCKRSSLLRSPTSDSLLTGLQGLPPHPPARPVWRRPGGCFSVSTLRPCHTHPSPHALQARLCHGAMLAVCLMPPARGLPHTHQRLLLPEGGGLWAKEEHQPVRSRGTQPQASPSHPKGDPLRIGRAERKGHM